MRRNLFIVTVLLALMVTACASPQAPALTSAPAAQIPATAAPATMEPTTAPAATEASTAQLPVTGSSVSLALSSSGSLGPILVDDKGMTLYLFEKDTPGTSACYDKCAANWPPLLTTGAPISGDGLDASLLGTTQRKDGTMQVTYNGWPVYYYAKDKKPGDTVGQGVGDIWFVVTAAGQPGPAAAAAPQSAPTQAPAANPY